MKIEINTEVRVQGAYSHTIQSVIPTIALAELRKYPNQPLGKTERL